MKKWNILRILIPAFCALCLIVNIVFFVTDVVSAISFSGILLLLAFCLAISPVLTIIMACIVAGIIVMYVWDVVKEKRVGLIGMVILLTVDAAIHIVCMLFSWWHLLAALADVFLALGMMLVDFHRNES